MSEAPEYRICSNAPFALDCTLDKTLTVAAWVESSTARAEAMQPLVSQWQPRAAFDAFDAYDAGHTDGLVTQGYFGAVCDGRYAYFCPIRDQQERTSVHGRVLRLDTQADFKNPDAWTAYDASHTDGLHTAGFYGGAFDGRYVYFNPRDDGTIHHSRLLRYDTQADFKDPDAWAAYDAQFPHSGQGLAFDGHYLYFCPGYTRSSTRRFGRRAQRPHPPLRHARAPEGPHELYRLQCPTTPPGGDLFRRGRVRRTPYLLRAAQQRPRPPLRSHRGFRRPTKLGPLRRSSRGDADERRCRVRRAAHLFLRLWQ